DIDSINWLEGFFKNYPGTIFFVTHDRQFMEHLTTRIMELDRGKLMSWACDYKTFLERKQLALTIEAAQREDFENKLADEEVWIRQGVKARRCRNEGRVKALEKMRAEKQAQRQRIGQVRFRLQETDPSGHLVVKASRLGLSFGDNCLIRDFSTNIMRADRIGLIGPNGSGKTSLLRILLGKMKPSKGTIRQGTNLEVAYYDQLREQLDEEKTVMENVAGNSETVTINGKPRHVIGYLQDFLFPPDRARTPVKVLSGGERNRLLLARLFTRPSNVLVMDEPTNDLDIETLELLEELLMDYSGTLLLVSHDRAFLNNVVTSTIVLEGGGEVNEFPGGYDDWLSQRKVVVAEGLKEKKGIGIQKIEKMRSPGKLSYKESRELESLPAKIEELEWEQKKSCSLLADPDFYKREPQEIAEARTRSEVVASELIEAYRRWEELETLKQGGG
ncbi:MAG: ATP-binding cassette domain-containing protein, partial [Candidatus Omnitrophica bacterium]|nr:ATP-binding cassette domain-containing protein [Candidatus Omnitrophota bacterium]